MEFCVQFFKNIYKKFNIFKITHWKNQNKNINLANGKNVKLTFSLLGATSIVKIGEVRLSDEIGGGGGG